MARRQQNKTQQVQHAKNDLNNKTKPGSRIPQTMVVRMGKRTLGSSASQLALDTRSVMEPHTATRLRERRGNRLRDFATMAGPLGVSHFLLFNRAEESGNVNLRIAVHPRGPTLTFRVEKYSLCKDVAKSQARPKQGGTNFRKVAPPLVVMNNFTTPQSEESPVPRHLESLTTSTFQSLFPPVSPQTTPLSSIRRVLLLNRDMQSHSPSGMGGINSAAQPYTIELRHYSITSKPVVSLSKGVKRLQRAAAQSKKHPQKPPELDQLLAEGPEKKRRKGGVPRLGKLSDVADMVLDPDGQTSASESEFETDAEVEVLEQKAGRAERRNGRDARGKRVDEKKARSDPSGQKRAIKLTELGPRMRLRLYKVEEGFCTGKVLWHESITKTKDEERKMEKTFEARQAEKERRKNVQKQNVERKRTEKKQQVNGQGAENKAGGEEEKIEDEEELWSDEDMEE